MGFFSKKDHAADWINMSEDEKAEAVRLNFDSFVPSYLRARFMRQSPNEITQLINSVNVAADNEGWFTQFAEQTTAHYKNGQSNKSSSKVIMDIASNHVKQSLGLA